MNADPSPSRRGMLRRLGLPAMGIALANLAALGLLIGIVGASRAFSVGVQTLFRDHLPAVALTMVATALLAAMLGRRVDGWRDVGLLIGFALVADVLGAVAVTLIFDEMRRAPEVAVSRAIFTETVGGLQLVAIAGGAAGGYAVGRRRQR